MSETSTGQLIPEPDPVAQAPRSEMDVQAVGGEHILSPDNKVIPASWLANNKVLSSDGDELGKISDVMLDVQSGRIAYLVLESGGFLGIGGTRHALPWRALTIDLDRQYVLLGATAETVRGAQSFELDNRPAMAGRDWGEKIHQHYGVQAYWSIEK